MLFLIELLVVFSPFLTLNLHTDVETIVIRLQGVSKQDPGCQNILSPHKCKHFYLISENKNMFPNIRLKWFLFKGGIAWGPHWKFPSFCIIT